MRQLLRCALLFAVVTVANAARAQQAVILDDDCSNDVDCVLTMPILFEMQHRGDVRVLAVMADSANPQSAAVMKIFAQQAGYPNVPIGANKTDEPSTPLSMKNKANESWWTQGLVARFDGGDDRTHYLPCAMLYRAVLAKAPDHSVAIAATGFPTCLNQLLATKADEVSVLSGAELVRRKVSLLSVMGGKYPSGKEWNFMCDAPGWHALTNNWTKWNKFPPIYFNGFDNGLNVVIGAAEDADPRKDATKYALDLYGTKSRPMWDMLSVLYAAWGAQHDGKKWFTVSEEQSVRVDPESGESVLVPEKSGHFVITNAQPDSAFDVLLQGMLDDAASRMKSEQPKLPADANQE